MLKFGVLFILVLFLISTAYADTTPWAWNSYVGVSHWKVTYSEDDTACGNDPPIVTGQYTTDIKHNLASASLEDVHGPVSGTFVSGNVLDIKKRTVPDQGGTSTIYDYSLFFTTDCGSFAGSYKWDYSDQYQSCSGTTKLSGTNTQSGCPILEPSSCQTSLDCNTTSSCVNNVCVPTQTQGMCTKDTDCNSGNICSNGACVSAPPLQPPPTPIAVQLVSARSDLEKDLLSRKYLDHLTEQLIQASGWYPPGSPEEGYAKVIRDQNPGLMKNALDGIDKSEADIEAKYQAILAVDPSNVQANWDMAQLRKGQAKFDDYQNYLDKSLGKITDNQANAIKSDVQSSLGLQNTPTKDTSKVVQQLGNEEKQITSVAGIDVTTLTQKQRNNLMQGILVMSLFDKNGDVLSSLNIQFK